MLALRGGSPVRTAPWPTWPERGDLEIAAVSRTVASGRWGGYPAPGPEATKFGDAWAAYVGARHAVLAANGSVTLKVILRGMGVEAGDEVIVPSLTWIATAGAAVWINAVPVFADVDPRTLCIDPESVETLITPRTKAVICVHLGSTMSDLDALRLLCKRHGLKLIEDCAHAHGMRWRELGAGSIGDAGSFSFQSSKLLTSGEGGAITTNDLDLSKRCQSLVNCGRKEAHYGDYAGESFGWNDRITELQASLLSAQLARLDDQRARRQANLRHFEDCLAQLGDVGFAAQHRDARITRHDFYQLVMLYDRSKWKGLPRDKFVDALEAEGVPADGGFYVPIFDRVGEIFPLKASQYPSIRHRYGDQLLPSSARCPVASEAAYERTVWLHHGLFLGSKSDVEDIVKAIAKIRENVDELL